MNLVIYFCLLVGDYVCETCNVWKYYLSLKDIVRAGQYLNTLYLNTVFKYIYCIYTLYLNTFFNLYLNTFEVYLNACI